jgi:hypothetical protein
MTFSVCFGPWDYFKITPVHLAQHSLFAYVLSLSWDRNLFKRYLLIFAPSDNEDSGLQDSRS